MVSRAGTYFRFLSKVDLIVAAGLKRICWKGVFGETKIGYLTASAGDAIG